MAARVVTALAVASTLQSCATFTALPLQRQAGLAPDLAALRHDAALPPALGVSDIVRLVLLNNPDLTAVRVQHSVAEAQLLQSGILPNPQASLSATPTLAGPGTTTAWNAGFTQDLRSLILRPSLQRTARASLRQIDAQILWQEWQAVGQARLLAVQLIEEQRTLALLDDLRRVLARHVAERQQALAARDATYTLLAPDLAALADLEARLRDARRLALQQRHTLAALLGLQPEAAFTLARTVDLPPLDAEAIRAALPGLPERRPDLLALRWGYEAANQRLRGAILSQFPNLSFGASGGSDNSNVRGFGPQLNLELPLFDRNQGNIAIARATRRQLHDEYGARVTATEGDVRARLDEIALLRAQIAAARRRLPAVREAARTALQPDSAQLLDPQVRIDLLAASTTREAEFIALQQSLLEQEVAIETLAGFGMPAARTDLPRRLQVASDR
ncbi:TolC family protein [Lichenicoccus sp.]|uniref:TolC family protein n=1 Tax=Lichenicoccus sp. TaxID=2781899 RepID=UPI003D0B1DDB